MGGHAIEKVPPIRHSTLCKSMNSMSKIAKEISPATAAPGEEIVS
jgi:hypothetical protein